nr:prenyltransferase-like protein [uncultured bacterium]
MNSTAFAQHALAQIPKILTLQDRNAHSPTYGCFDRNFWHYKIIDFPSGMAAEFVWPLALAYSLPLEGSPYHGNAAIKEWAEAGMRYAAKSAHPDGSCDDYFPFEKAAGAAAFSLLAALESYTLLGLQSDELKEFFGRRADWLANHHESGRLTNHQALTVLCLEKAGRLLKTNRWDELKKQRLKRVLEWQNSEGWFQEYEGCDPGYHTLTIGILAQVQELSPSPELKTALEKAIRFALHFIHPDGSFGGEYTSRNTYNFFPHGFEIAGRWLPEALEITTRFLAGLERGLAPCYADDHIIGHHTWSYLLAHQHFVAERPALTPRVSGRHYFRNAGIVIERRENTELYLALNKGGVFKLFRDGRLVLSDTQFSALVLDQTRERNAVAHLVGKYDVDFSQETISVRGDLGWAKTKGMTTANLIILRVLMYSVGRFNPDLVRRLLQKLLITGKKAAPLRFSRRFTWRGAQLQIEDELETADWSKVTAAGIGASQTSIYVVMSRTYQAGQLQPWLDLTSQARNLAPGAPLKLSRTL